MLFAVVLCAGDQLDGRYRVVQLISRGAMGEVWKGVRIGAEAGSDMGWDIRPGQLVAIKTLQPRTAQNTEIRRRFEREARAVARIRSAHVCTLLDRGVTLRGDLFLVFEMLWGESLAQRLERELFLPFEETAHLLLDTLQGVHDAHQAQVLHRDLKPSNIFICNCDRGDGDDGQGGEADRAPMQRAVVLDFGVAKIVGRQRAFDEPSITAFDDTVGSFSYMAPEQIRGAARVDERADVYAVATVGFLCLTGRLPFEGMTARMVADLKLQQKAPSLRSVTGYEWPREVEQFFSCCLAEDPKERLPSAMAAKEHVAQLLDLMRSARA